MIYSSILKSQRIYIIHGKGYYIDKSTLEQFKYFEGGFLRDINVVRVYYIYQSVHETLNNCIYFYDYWINAEAFCCPDKFCYLNDKNELVIIPAADDRLKLYMNLETKDFYILYKDSTDLVIPEDISTQVEDDILIIDEKKPSIIHIMVNRLK